MKIYQVYYMPQARQSHFETEALGELFVKQCVERGFREQDFFYDEIEIISSPHFIEEEVKRYL